jgi:hypothetical protein
VAQARSDQLGKFHLHNLDYSVFRRRHGDVSSKTAPSLVDEVLVRRTRLDCVAAKIQDSLISNSHSPHFLAQNPAFIRKFALAGQHKNMMEAFSHLTGQFGNVTADQQTTAKAWSFEEMAG